MAPRIPNKTVYLIMGENGITLRAEIRRDTYEVGARNSYYPATTTRTEYTAELETFGIIGRYRSHKAALKALTEYQTDAPRVEQPEQHPYYQVGVPWMHDGRQYVRGEDGRVHEVEEPDKPHGQTFVEPATEDFMGQPALNPRFDHRTPPVNPSHE